VDCRREPAIDIALLVVRKLIRKLWSALSVVWRWPVALAKANR
jgi:hypothetical protein